MFFFSPLPFWTGQWRLLEVTPALTQLSLTRKRCLGGGRGRGGGRQLKEAPPRKIKQGVCPRSRKGARQSIHHHTSICSLSSCRRAQPRRAATSRWCSATCGGAKAFQGEDVSLQSAENVIDFSNKQTNQAVSSPLILRRPPVFT